MTDTLYRCRRCDTRTDSFMTACPDCGEQSYDRVLDDHDATNPSAETELAKLSRPLNPLAPM
jgi:predicted  nucleic acid-binding Zn-ribbon protein